MGKESEVLQAAQDGNLSKLESLFTQKRFGGFLRGPNINARDDSGCTALHLSSLNGHKDVVIFLLHNDASANIPDNAGSYPLHLAAFNGHHEITNTLITRGPSRAQVNEANMAGDTPMHVAAQYGHEKVVKVLLSCHADATARNSREESALDLAAQYGRISTVELFLTINKTLCYKDAVHRHSPLHLASRNGHYDVVRLLLDNGMSVNATCDMGTALHCAALFGKVAIAKLLLEKGIDIEIEDDSSQKVLDLLVKHPSKRAQEITALIYATPSREDMEMSRSPAASYSGQQFEVIDRHKKETGNEVISTPSGYDYVPPPRPKPAKTDEDRPYSLVDSSPTNNLSDDENNFDLASATTPLGYSAHKKGDKFFSRDSDTSDSSSQYSLIGEEISSRKQKTNSIKQKRTSKRNSTPIETAGGTYTEIPPFAHPHAAHPRAAPLNPGRLQSSKPLTGYIDMGSKDEIKESLDEASSRNSTGSDSIVPDFPPPTPAQAQQQLAEQLAANYNNIYQAPASVTKKRSQTLPVYIGKTPTAGDVYDNVKLQNTPSSTDIYDNIQLTNSPAEGDTYDNVHITNKQQLSSGSSPFSQNTNDMFYQQSPNMAGSLSYSPSSQNTNDMYYQRPPSMTGSLSHSPSSQNTNDMFYQQPPSMTGSLSHSPSSQNTNDMFYQQPPSMTGSLSHSPSSQNTNDMYYQQPPSMTGSLSHSPSSQNTSDMYYQQPPSMAGSLSHSPSSQNTNDMYYQQPPNMMDSITSNDMYYQAPTSTTFKQKPISQPGGIKQTASAQQQYTSVKTKSMKQKRTGTTIKRTISLDDNIDDTLELNKKPPAAIHSDTSQIPESQSSVDAPLENSSTENNTKVDTEDVNLNIESAADTINKELTATKSEENDEETPVPKPRTEIIQSRAERSVESGYRMSQVAQKQPLNETYEWNKIDAFLSNLEEFAGGSPTIEEKEPPKKPINSVSDWLESIALSLYEPMLVTNGFDEFEFINGSLDDQDLIELGILHSDHRKKIIQSSQTLPKVPVIGEDGVPVPTSLLQWLKLIKLEGYENRFNINGYGNIDRVRVVWELELVTVLDINAIGHRKRMLTSLGRKPLQIKAPVSWAQRFADAEAGKVKNAPLPDDSMELAQKLMETAKGLTVERTGKNTKQPVVTSQSSTTSDTPPPPSSNAKIPQAPAPAPLDKENKENEKPNNANKRLTKRLEWLHSPDQLLYESVAYTAQYLGSHPVQRVKGVESTLDACSKMKVLSQNVHKMPSIVLSISVRGIDYIDSNSKMIINSYSIAHISFCAQDPNNLTVFAYITRDELTRKNYCHVFKAQSTRQADEIVLTLGQCFEVAYEQHMALLELKKAQVQQDIGNTKREPPPPPTPYAERIHKQN